MNRLSLLLTGLAFASAPAAAATYSATLATPTVGRFIARDITWNCGASACLGATEQSRPVVLCQSLAKRAGPVESFVVDGSALAAVDLQRCNMAAKARSSSIAPGK